MKIGGDMNLDVRGNSMKRSVKTKHLIQLAMSFIEVNE